MGWALLWAFIIGSTAAGDKTGSGAGILAFLVIWYFADKSERMESIAKKSAELLSAKEQELWQYQTTPKRITREYEAFNKESYPP